MIGAMRSPDGMKCNPGANLPDFAVLHPGYAEVSS